MDNLKCIKILNKYDVNATNIKINSLNIYNIIDFDKFKLLRILNCNNNHIIKIINLPETLIYLYCVNNKNIDLTNIPNSIEYLYCLNELDCSYNSISNLDNLPSSITELNCSGNDIKFLANLPKNLRKIEYYGIIVNKPDKLVIVNKFKSNPK